MSNNAQFHLFPPPLPKGALKSKPNNSVGKESSVELSSSVDSLYRVPETSVVVIQIDEEPARKHSASNDSAISLRSSTSPEPPSDRSGSATLVRGNSSPSAARSPIIPFRSMFPTYNKSLPLSQQNYGPARTYLANAQSLPTAKNKYGSRVLSPSIIDVAVGGPRTAPASLIDFPMDDFPLSKQKFSTPEELAELWDATNGQDPNQVHGKFDLEMARTELATFTFGPEPSKPFYTLQTYDTNEIGISRINPKKSMTKVQILLLALEASARRLPPNDGLVSYIFPRLAAMLAMDQSTALASKHKLAPTHRDEMQADAVGRAANQEACHLIWNEFGKRYELIHPAIGRDPNKTPRTPHFAVSPITPQDGEKPVLHITVSSHHLSSPLGADPPPPVIIVTNPNSSTSQNEAIPADPRLSRISNVSQGSDEPLAFLDFGTMNLHIDAAAILRLMPSLYAVDCIASALLAVAVADEATNPIMANLEIWLPMPKAPASVFGGSVGGSSYTGDKFFATIAEQQEAQQETKLMERLKKANQNTKQNASKTPSFWTRKQKPAERKATKQIVIEEFDLERLGRYQTGDRKGQQLPGVTRGVLKMLVYSLQIVVWGLTLFVKVVSWALVGLTRALTSEKF